MTVVEWLLDSDPSIRWQVMRDLTDEPGEVIAAERSKVAVEGWGARLLALQGPGGQWGTDIVDHIEVPADGPLPGVEDRRLLRDLVGLSPEQMARWLGVAPTDIASWETPEPDLDGEHEEKYRTALRRMRASVGTFFPAWTSTFFTLTLLRSLGLDPSSDEARRAVALVRDNCRWDEGGQPFFSGEVEPCINGRVVALGTYFGQDIKRVVERLLGEQLSDGGWNCEAERGSTRSSFHTTICVLEGLLEYEQATGGSADVTEARLRGEEYLLERRMFRRLSNGEVVDPAWTLFSFPTRWHYDVLRGLDYLRSAAAEPDERCAEAIDLVEEKRGEDGRWLLENPHPGRVHFDMEEGEGKPSRWNTLRALRVLDWYEHHRGSRRARGGGMERFEASAVTHLLVVSDAHRSREWYVQVLDAAVYGEYGGTSVVLEVQGCWLLLVTGGGPTADKPSVTFAPPADPDRVSAELIFRVDDCRACYDLLVSRGAAFLTEPVEHGGEIRAFFRDPDGHLLEISQRTPLA